MIVLLLEFKYDSDDKNDVDPGTSRLNGDIAFVSILEIAGLSRRLTGKLGTASKTKIVIYRDLYADAYWSMTYGMIVLYLEFKPDSDD